MGPLDTDKTGRAISLLSSRSVPHHPPSRQRWYERGEIKHTTLEKRYALKLIPSELVLQKGFIERFRREARVMAHLAEAGGGKIEQDWVKLNI